MKKSWKCGQLLVWDATCPDTFAPSYRTHATSEPGHVAALAEDRKVDKYRDLPRSHLFCPLSIETMGAMGPRSLELVREVGRMELQLKIKIFIIIAHDIIIHLMFRITT